MDVLMMAVERAVSQATAHDSHFKLKLCRQRILTPAWKHISPFLYSSVLFKFKNTVWEDEVWYNKNIWQTVHRIEGIESYEGSRSCPWSWNNDFCTFYLHWIIWAALSKLYQKVVWKDSAQWSMSTFSVHFCQFHNACILNRCSIHLVHILYI